MSDLERPYVERRASGAPSSCPVCGAATRYLGDTGIITCRSPAGPDHFEWRPTPERVASERVEWRDPEPRTLAGTAERIDPVGKLCGFLFYWWDGEYEGSCVLDLDHDGDHWDGLSWANDVGECVDYKHESDPDNRRYDNLVPWVAPQAQVEVDPPPPLEGELLGVDYLTATAARLGGDAGRLAQLHAPVYDSPPRCSGCGSDGPISRLNRRANWPCATAKLALEMMRLSPSDIAITKKE